MSTFRMQATMSDIYLHSEVIGDIQIEASGSSGSYRLKVTNQRTGKITKDKPYTTLRGIKSAVKWARSAAFVKQG